MEELKKIIGDLEGKKVTLEGIEEGGGIITTSVGQVKNLEEKLEDKNKEIKKLNAEKVQAERSLI